MLHYLKESPSLPCLGVGTKQVFEPSNACAALACGDGAEPCFAAAFLEFELASPRKMIAAQRPLPKHPRVRTPGHKTLTWRIADIQGHSLNDAGVWLRAAFSWVSQLFWMFTSLSCYGSLMSTESKPLPGDLAILYRRAFLEYGASALWSSRAVSDPTPEDALAITHSLRVEGDLGARRLAELIEEACRAPH